MKIDNVFESLPGHREEEAFEDLASGEGTRIQRIVSHGHASPPDFWYDQGEHEWVLLLAGAAACGPRLRRRRG